MEMRFVIGNARKEQETAPLAYIDCNGNYCVSDGDDAVRIEKDGTVLPLAYEDHCEWWASTSCVNLTGRSLTIHHD